MKMNMRRGGVWVRLALCVSIVLVFTVLVSCVPPTKGGSNSTGALSGTIENAVLAVKDYDVKGVIWVQSQEKEIKSNSGVILSGSKITHGMLMAEAVKLGADDVINLRVDVSISEELVKTGSRGNPGRAVQEKVVVYNYSATALAIKYTKAVVADAGVKQYFKGIEPVNPEAK